MGNPLKIIKFYDTVLISTSKDVEVKLNYLPSTINFQNIPPYKRSVEISNFKNIESIFFAGGGKNQKELKLDTARNFTQSELSYLAELFDLNIGTLEHANDYNYCYKSGVDPRYTRAFMILSMNETSTLATVYFPGGHNNFDEDLPFIWRIAEAELSQEFRTKIGW